MFLKRRTVSTAYPETLRCRVSCSENCTTIRCCSDNDGLRHCLPLRRKQRFGRSARPDAGGYHRRHGRWCISAPFGKNKKEEAAADGCFLRFRSLTVSDLFHVTLRILKLHVLDFREYALCNRADLNQSSGSRLAFLDPIPRLRFLQSVLCLDTFCFVHKSSFLLKPCDFSYNVCFSGWHRFGTVPLRTEWKRHRILLDLAPCICLSKVVRIVAPLDRPKEKMMREVAPSNPSC